MSTDELKKQLKKEIFRTGFPLEIEVQSMLEERGWAVFPTHFFIDPETGKQREIDIFAFHRSTAYGKETEPIAFSPQLLIECKKSRDYSAVLFSREIPAFTFYDFTGQVFDFPVLLKERTGFPHPLKEFNLGNFLADPKLHYSKLRKVATHFPMLKPKGKQKSDLYEAVMKLTKAQSFEVKQAMRRSETITHPYHPLYFSFLAVVFDGLMFEATLENGDVKLRELDHLLIWRGFQPDYEYFGVPLQYTIDVVKKEYFARFLLEIEKDIQTLIQKVKLNIGDVCQYLKRPERKGVVL